MFYFQAILRFLLLPFSLAFLVSTNTFGVDYETPVMLPVCDSQNPKVLFISQNSHWSKINQKDKTIFCVYPGNYSVRPVLEVNGMSKERRFILYYKPNEGKEIHPANMQETDRAMIDQLYFSNTSWWVVDRITVKGTRDSSVRMYAGATDIILNRLLVEGSGGGGGQVANGGKNLVIQNSVIRNTKVTPKLDDHCIGITQGTKNLKIVNNEIYNCAGDGLQANNGDGSTGVIIADNDFYMDSSYYTDCKGKFDSLGDCMCGENGLDIKSGGPGSFEFSKDRQLLIIGNRIWGFNKPDDKTCATGAGGGGGKAVIVHLRAQGLRFEENLIFDSNFGIGFANDTAKYISVINNLFFNLDNGLAWVRKSNFNEYYYNTWLNISNWFYDSVGNEKNHELLCNVIINTSNTGLSARNNKFKFDFNAYYKSSNYHTSGKNDKKLLKDKDSRNQTYCFTKKQITNPHSFCVPLAVTSVKSPHADMCKSAKVGTQKNRGVDDLKLINRSAAGFIPSH